MTEASSISVLGAGAWGTALASAIARPGRGVTLWGRSPATCNEINQARTNHRYLGKSLIPEGVTATSDLEEAIRDARIILMAVPAQQTRMTVEALPVALHEDAVVLCCAKGIEVSTGKLQTEIVSSIIDQNVVGVLSGPSFAADLAEGLPTAVVIATDNLDHSQQISEDLSSNILRYYASDDLVGVQIGGALKNVLAIGVGICRGARLGASAEAALINRGHKELSRVGLAMGAQQATLDGLSGLGDLVLTCSSPLSRNFSYGVEIGRGVDHDPNKLVEGVHTIRMALEISQRYDLETPIIETTYRVTTGELTVEDGVASLMGRPVRAEVI